MLQLKNLKFEFKADRPPGSTSIKDAKKTQVTDLKTEATKRKSVDDLIDEYNANQDRLRLSDEEGGTLIGYEEYEQLRKRNKDIAKALEDKGISSKVEKNQKQKLFHLQINLIQKILQQVVELVMQKEVF
jgi:hypothetical protein